MSVPNFYQLWNINFHIMHFCGKVMMYCIMKMAAVTFLHHEFFSLLVLIAISCLLHSFNTSRIRLLNIAVK